MTQGEFDERSGTQSAPLERFVPVPSAVDEVSDAFARTPRDALGILQLGEALKQRLLDRHAPILALAPQGHLTSSAK